MSGAVDFSSNSRLKTPYRIVVIGTSCAGKTTFSRTLGKQLQIPVIELDTIHWLPDWQERSLEEFRVLLAASVAEHPQWIIDGNYGKVRDISWRDAQTIIWLNYSFPRVLWRSIKRTVWRVVSKELMFSNNRETFRQAFLSRNSIIFWVIKTFHRRRRDIQKLEKSPEYRHLTFIEFRYPSAAATFLKSVAGELKTAGR